MTRRGASWNLCGGLRRSLAGAIALATVAALPAQAQDPDASATIKLIHLLITKGILTHDQAESLLKQAQDEAPPVRKPSKSATARRAAAPGAADAPAHGAPAEPLTPPPQGTVRVTYVPQIVREQIAQEVRTQVMQQAQSEGWAAPYAAPDWTKRLRFYGDVRMRGERVLENGSNTPLPDFNAINNGAGFDTSGGGGLPPSLNTLQDRTRFRLRARLGVQAELDDWVSADIRIATGNDNSPVSTNQTLGSGGDFAKYALWLDRAYLLLQPLKPFDSLAPFHSLKMYVGREPNPFWTSDLVYDENVNFDGVGLTGTYKVNGMLDVFANAGAFSMFNTDFNFSSLNESKFPSHDKFLLAGQIGAVVRPVESLSTKFAAGFFAYSNMQGKLSSSCTIIQSGYGCDTDATRAQFVQYGNTLFGIRDIATNGSSSATPEYFGLASRFNILDLHAQADYTGFTWPISLEGEFSKNLGFNRKAVAALGPVNNLNGSSFKGGDTAYMLKLTVGTPTVAQRWDWNAFIAYKYLERNALKVPHCRCRRRHPV